jgi:hypothetical protein
MASESHFKTIQQLTCFMMKNRVKSNFFTSDIVLTSQSTRRTRSLYLERKNKRNSRLLKEEHSRKEREGKNDDIH